MLSWTHNIYGEKVEKFLKKYPGSFRSPYIDSFQGPKLDLGNYRNPGSIIAPVFDTYRGSMNKNEKGLPFTFIDLIFYSERYPLLFGEKTEAYKELLHLIHNGPNVFKPFDMNNVILRYFLSVDDNIFNNHLSTVTEDHFKFKDFSSILPPDVVENSNLSTRR